jgi:hypothetical protein
MNECPVVKKYKEKLENERRYDAALSDYRSKSNKPLEQCATILSQTSEDLDSKLYYAKIATQVKY